ncbi:prepilin-type N-terminal cleavage/methylation domain-containing protein, partial [Erysipelatoclostridium ramosum]|nr:prepilin-type N-terminal cleavage/methylation domain-containing protein [Thomasclavelia ramosa]
MKNHSAYRRLREAKGFTLMEILVVMVIIVVLATLTISIYTWLETRKNEQATESIVRKI